MKVCCFAHSQTSEKFKLSKSTLLELKQFFTLTEIEATIEAAEAYLEHTC
jgi:hypothetical protein